MNGISADSIRTRIDLIVSMALARILAIVEFSAVNRINSITYLHNLRASDAHTLNEE